MLLQQALQPTWFPLLNNMANVFATKSGNWSDITVWNTGRLPTSADDVFANNFTVTIDVSARVLSIRTTRAGILIPINAGGSFVLNNSISLSANVLAGTSTCLSFPGASPNSATVVGNISGSNFTSDTYGLHVTTTGIVTVFGSVHGGTNSVDSLARADGIRVGNNNGGTINIFGNLYGGGLRSGGPACALVLAASANANIVGNVYGGNYDFFGLAGGNVGIAPGSNSTVSITGNVYAGNATNGVFNSGIWANASSNGVVNILGNVYGAERGGNGTHSGITNSSDNFTYNITGNVYGGNFQQPGTGYYTVGISDGTATSVVNVKGNVYAGAAGVGIVTRGRLNVDGDVYAGNTPPAFFQDGNAFGILIDANTAVVSARRAIGNDGGFGSYDLFGCPAIANIYQNATVIVRELQCGRRGQFPVTGPVYVQPLSSSVCIMKTDTFENVSLILSNSATDLLPSVSNVRSGVSYNQGSSTGTLIMPDPATVALGVPTDNTNGTATTPPISSIWNTDLNTLTSTSLSGNMGYRLKDAATAQNMGYLIAAFNG